MLFSYFLQKIFGVYAERPYLCNAKRVRRRNALRPTIPPIRLPLTLSHIMDL